MHRHHHSHHNIGNAVAFLRLHFAYEQTLEKLQKDLYNIQSGILVPASDVKGCYNLEIFLVGSTSSSTINKEPNNIYCNFSIHASMMKE